MGAERLRGALGIHRRVGRQRPAGLRRLFASLIGCRIAEFVRPDLSLACGITGVKTIVAVAEASFVRVFRRRPSVDADRPPP
ncbi:MAG: hypothetical protein OXH96_23235 [Spirochaetaceae bacterium]|nr:hypothetical protein [Spirochaetaceae bacterium]